MDFRNRQSAVNNVRAAREMLFVPLRCDVSVLEIDVSFLSADITGAITARMSNFCNAEQIPVDNQSAECPLPGRRQT